MSLFSDILVDCKAALSNDPALQSHPLARLELILYQGIHAMILHRVAHILWNLNIPFIPRLISQISRFLTQIEIHPGAKISPGCFIDHGAGVVIGETAVVGKNVIIYHQVTLGGTSRVVGKRHPTIGDGVLVGAGAKLFGPIVVGNNSQIGGGAVITKDVPPNCVVVGNPARIVRREGLQVTELLDTTGLPDPIAERFEQLEAELAALKNSLAP